MKHSKSCIRSECYKILLCPKHEYFSCYLQDHAATFECTDCKSLYLSTSICSYHNELCPGIDVFKNPRCSRSHKYCTECLKKLQYSHFDIKCMECKAIYIPDRFLVKTGVIVCLFCNKRGITYGICENHVLCGECNYLVQGNTRIYSLFFWCTKCQDAITEKLLNSHKILDQCFNCQSAGKIVNPSCHEKHYYCENCIEKSSKCKSCNYYLSHKVDNNCFLCKKNPGENPSENFFCLMHKYCNNCRKLLESTTYIYKQIKCETCIIYFYSNKFTSLQPRALTFGLDTVIQNQSSLLSRNLAKTQYIQELPTFIKTHKKCKICNSECALLECHHVFCMNCYSIVFTNLFHVFIQTLIAGNLSYLYTDNFKIRCIEEGCFNTYCFPLRDFSELFQSILAQYTGYYHINFIDHYSLFFEGFQMKFEICSVCGKTIGVITNPICFYCNKSIT